jgi:hypothetical protein
VTSILLQSFRATSGAPRLRQINMGAADVAGEGVLSLQPQQSVNQANWIFVLD